MTNKDHLRPDNLHPKVTELIAELRTIEPDKRKWFKAKRGYPDWTFRQLVEYKGFDEAVRLAKGYSKIDRFRGRLTTSSRTILAALNLGA